MNTTQTDLHCRKKSVLDIAHEVIYGDREKTYGNPAKNLTAIAEFWNTYIQAAKNVQADLTADDVCVMMVLLKAARLANQIDHKDSQVDSCGYMALLERIQEHAKAAASTDKLETITALHKQFVSGGNHEEINKPSPDICKHFHNQSGRCVLEECSCRRYGTHK